MAIELPSLYDHQGDLRDLARDALAKHRRVIITLPPGGGKTRLAKWIIGATANRNPSDNQSGRSLFTVHRRGLVDNASNSFNESPECPHGVIMSGVKPGYGARIQVASIDTMLSWFIEEGEYATNLTFDMIVFDECHSHHAKLMKLLERHDAMRAEMGLHPAFLIGLSATPEAKGLSDTYHKIVQGPSTQWLIDNGFLSPFRYFRATQGQLGKLVKRGSEFTKESEAAAMDGLAGDLVRDWKKYAEGRPTVGFFPRRSHAQDAKEQLEAAGLRVDYIDGDTDDLTRQRIFWELSNGNLDYLCNVQVVERGTDIPRVACIQLCVAVGSVVRFLQMVGRGSRIHPEKTDCLVLDHGGNVGHPPRGRHGFFEDERHWSLDQSTKDAGDVSVKPTIECPECNAIYRGGKCRSCGYEPTPKQRRSQGLDFDGSELVEVKPTESKTKSVKSPEDLMVSALYSAGRSGRTWKQAVGMFFGMSKKQGTRYKVPKTVEVGGNRYRMVPYGSADSGRRVGHLYPFTKTRGNHSGKYLESPA